MTKLPKGLLRNSIHGKHAMRHQNGIWNAMQYDLIL